MGVVYSAGILLASKKKRKQDAYEFTKLDGGMGAPRLIKFWAPLSRSQPHDLQQQSQSEAPYI